MKILHNLIRSTNIKRLFVHNNLKGLPKAIEASFNVSSLNLIQQSYCNYSTHHFYSSRRYIHSSIRYCNYKRNLCTMPPINIGGLSPAEVIKKCIAENKVMVFSKSFCPFCNKVRVVILV